MNNIIKIIILIIILVILIYLLYYKFKLFGGTDFIRFMYETDFNTKFKKYINFDFKNANDSSEFSSGNDELKNIIDKTFFKKYPVKYNTFYNLESSYKDMVEFSIKYYQCKIWNNYVKLLNEHFKNLKIDEKLFNEKYIVVGDIHASYFNFFEPLVRTGLIKNLSFNPVSVKGNYEIVLSDKKQTIKIDMTKTNYINYDNLKNIYYNSNEFNFINYNFVSDEEYEQLKTKNIKIIYTGDIIDHSIHGMDLGLVDMLMKLTKRFPNNIYWCYGNHDVSLLLYCLNKTNKKVEIDDNYEFEISKTNRYSNKIKLWNHIYSSDKYNIDVSPRFIKYEDFYGFDKTFINNFINYSLNKNNKNALLCYINKINDNIIIVSHTIISKNILKNDKLSKNTKTDIYLKNKINTLLNKLYNNSSIYIYELNDLLDYNKVLSLLFANSRYSLNDDKLINLICDDFENLKVDYFIGHYNILNEFNLNDFDILNEFKLICEYSVNPLIFEEKINQKLINYFEDNTNLTIHYCDISASTFTNDYIRHQLGYEFISFSNDKNIYQKCIDVSSVLPIELIKRGDGIIYDELKNKIDSKITKHKIRNIKTLTVIDL